MTKLRDKNLILWNKEEKKAENIYVYSTYKEANQWNEEKKTSLDENSW